jgi:hypothetical protein
VIVNREIEKARALNELSREANVFP